eukprot:COSAG01_NODE_23948_length_795_cov_1712.301724_2_plen_40_part_01
MNVMVWLGLGIILSLFNLSHDGNPNRVTHTHAEKILVCEC